MPIDKRIEAHIRPQYVEFVRLSSEEHMNEVARRFFARREAQIKESRPGYKVDYTEFARNFSIDIRQYPNYYAEVGGTTAIRGNSFPTKKVRPIFTIRMSRTGKTWTVVALSCPGFFSQDLQRAWVKVDDYEEALGDTFFDDIQEKADKIRKAAEKQVTAPKKEKRRQVKVRDWQNSK